MSGSNVKIEWYLARDGQQHGPLSDAEMKKFVELGHLNATDLVWRAGFPEWRVASEVFPIGQGEAPPPPPPKATAPLPSATGEPNMAARQAPEPSESQASETTQRFDPASQQQPAAQGQGGTGAGANTDWQFQQSQDGQRAGNVASAGVPHGSYRPGGAEQRPDAGNSAQGSPQSHSTPASDDFDDDDFYDDHEPERRRTPVIAVTLMLLFVGMIGAGGWFAYANQDTIAKIIKDITADAGGEPAVVAAPKTPTRTPADGGQSGAQPSAAVQPAAVQPAAAPVGQMALLQSKLWQSFVSQFPDWASEKKAAAAQLRSAGKSEDEVLTYLINSIVDWRRQNADKVLAASPEHLRTLAKSFVANLKFLVEQDVQACYGFISKGEISPAVLPLFKDANQAGILGAQTEAIVAAAQNGGSTQTAYNAPQSSDFTDLAALLKGRGWSDADLKMFSDPAALSSAPAGKVCKLVTEWFDTQLAMPAGDKQMRLLATSLQPVVRG